MQVYVATWQETKVAAKLLLGPEVAAEADVAIATDQLLSATNPVMANLVQVVVGGPACSCSSCVGLLFYLLD